MKEEVLLELGFSKNEAKAYLSLLNSGPATGGQVSENSKVHRTNVYDALERLKEKGLVSYFTKDKTKYFEAANPKNLLNVLREKEQKLQEIMPQLKLSRKLAKTKSEASIFEGTSAFMDILYNFLEYKDPILAYGIPKNAPEMLKTKIPHFHKKRIPKKIVMKHIYNHSAKERIKYLNSLPYTEARYLPEKFDALVSTNICGEEVVLSLWTSPPIIIRIKDARIAEAYKRYFELMWNIAK